MGLLRLLFKLDADASGLKSKLHTAERDLTGFSRRSMRDFRTGFTTFFSVSALKNLVKSAYEFAEKYASDKEFRAKVQTLGTVIEENLVKQTRQAAFEIEALGYHMKHGLLMGVGALTPKILDMAAAVMHAGAFWGLASIEIGKIPEKIKFWNSLGFEGEKREVGDLLGQMLSGKKPKLSSEMENLFGESFKANLAEATVDVDKLVKAMRDGAALLAGQVTIKGKSEGAAAEAATAQTKRDSLASIGGFTSRADMEIQSISKRQLRELEKISNDTKNLNLGVGG